MKDSKGASAGGFLALTTTLRDTLAKPVISSRSSCSSSEPYKASESVRNCPIDVAMPCGKINHNLISIKYMLKAKQ